jgi:hypothetical protein
MQPAQRCQLFFLVCSKHQMVPNNQKLKWKYPTKKNVKFGESFKYIMMFSGWQSSFVSKRCQLLILLQQQAVLTCFSWVSSVPPHKCWDALKQVMPMSFPIHN